MPREHTDPAIVAAALAARRSGRSLRDVAAAYGVSAPTISRWEKSPPAPPPPPALPADVAARARALVAGAPEAPPEVEDPAPPEDDTLAHTRWQRRQLLRRADQAEREGQANAAARYRGEAVKLAPVIARLERDRAEDGAALHFTREQLAEAAATVRERVDAIISRPPLCAACSRALNVEVALGGPSGAEGKER